MQAALNAALYLGSGFGAVLPILELNESNTGTGGLHTVQDVDAHHGGQVLHRGVREGLLKLFVFSIGHLKRSIGLHHQSRQQEALVFIRQERLGHQLRHGGNRSPEQQQQRHGDNQLAAEPAADFHVHAGGAVIAPVKEFVERLEDAAALVGRLEHEGAQGRREREGVERRNEHRHRNGDGELLEERTGDAFQQQRRQEHRRQHQSNGDYRATHFLHGRKGSHARVEALVDVVLHGFHHHDGVIHHQTDGQYHTQQ